jgi:hypothetical protein
VWPLADGTVTLACKPSATVALTVTKTGVGTVTVTSNVGAIDCGATCSGACTGAAAVDAIECTLTLAADKNVTATCPSS